MEKKLYLITNRNLIKRPFWQVLEAALRGGVDIVQLREKDLPEHEVLAMAKKLREITNKYEKMLIINHFPKIAAAVGADGVHLGQGTASLKDVRKIIGPEKLLGVSVHNVPEAAKAQEEEADYLLVSHIFPTSCKAGLLPKGISLLKEIQGQVPNIPLVALGGINRDNFHLVLENGVSNIAVMSAIMAAEEPEIRTKELKKLWRNLQTFNE